jgi:hypothetical protein
MRGSGDATGIPQISPRPGACIERMDCASGRRETVYDEKYIIQKRRKCIQLFEEAKAAFRTLSDVKALESATQQAENADRLVQAAFKVKGEKEDQEHTAAGEVDKLKREATEADAAAHTAEEQVSTAANAQQEAINKETQAVNEFTQSAKSETREKLEAARQQRAQAEQRVKECQEQAEQAWRTKKGAEDECTAAEDALKAAKQERERADKRYEEVCKTAEEDKVRAAYLSSVESNVQWLTHKCNAGVAVAGTLDSQRLASEVLEELCGLCKELWAFWVPFKEFSKLDKQRLSRCEEPLTALGLALRACCLDLEAAKDHKPRWHFTQIEYHTDLMRIDLEDLKTHVEDWVARFPPDALKPVQDAVISLSNDAGVIAESAMKAAESCDAKAVQASFNMLCGKLTAIHATHDQLLCQLDLLACLPYTEPPFLLQARTKLELVGYHVANAAQVAASITLTEPNWVAQIQQAWQVIDVQIDAAQRETNRWAQTQLCTPPEACHGAIDRLQHCAREGKRQAALLQNDPTCREVLDRQRHWIECVHTELITLFEKTEHLRGFNRGVFNKAWWATAQITQALHPCPEEESPCLLTEGDIPKIVAWLKEQFGTAAGQPTQLHVPTYARSSAFAPMSKLVPQAGRMVSDGESVRRGPFYMEMLKKLEALACDLEPKVPARLKTRLARVIDEIQQQHCQVQASAGIGGAASARVLREIANRWHGLCASLSAILTSAKDAASPVQKKELIDWETRLSSLQPRTQDAIGYQPAFRDAMASERGVCAP